LFVLVAVFIMPLLPSIHVRATQATRDRVQQADRDRQRARDQVQDTQNLLQGVRYEMGVLMEQMRELDMRLVDAAEALEDVEMALVGTEARITAAEADLELAQQESDIQYELLRARLRAMHEAGPIGHLDVIFQAESFVDFLMRMENIRTISEFDQEVLDRLEDAERRVADNIELLDRERRLIGNLYLAQQDAMAQVEAALAEQAQWFETLAENEEATELLLEAQRAEQHALDVIFGQAQAALNAEIAEAERRRIADAAARAAAEQAERLQRLGSLDGPFHWPTPASARITSNFGPRTNPITRRSENHRGVDIGAPTGTRIYAAQDGYVRLAAWHGGYGLTVIIDHAGGYSTLYAHNSRNFVSAGQRVTRGQHIANVGSTGQSTGPHLHFEIRRNGSPVNPLQYFNF